ncbi:hypothetical protein, variant 1 [Aphanomyces astaci]|uniref:Uncharacterized protein n=1 Tax=Aphanomyces astaci TaxID=112090 RepID=W4FFZ1_APHAT|nr:hypothetical protein, variant 1 [Aphanomyces astaci]ETV65648.1 hypothetical protein, variant 1 [Aphanomyces astaci]|eukprot:XP_009844887.1 hypothetical protein, variant 1 [Aphanomyces astaci]
MGKKVTASVTTWTVSRHTCVCLFRRGVFLDSTIMGAASGVLQAESQRPLDASDVNTPRGESAKQEVIRLRALLANESAAASSQAQSSQHQASPSTGLPPLFARYAERIFLEVDVDQSGYLSYDELWSMIQDKMSLGLSPVAIEAIKAHSGLASGTDVSWQQFLTMLPELLKLQLRQSEASAADWCELSTETGSVYYYNKRTQLSQWDKPTWDLPADMQADMIAVFQAADMDGSGYLSWDEFGICLRHQLQLGLSDDQLNALQSQVLYTLIGRLGIGRQMLIHVF